MRPRLLISLLILFVGEILVGESLSWAEGSQSSLSLGLSYFPDSAAATVRTSGTFIHFQVEPRDGWLRPTYGGQIELNSGSSRLIDSQMLAGFEVVGATAFYVKPYLGLNGALGWANLMTPVTSYNGILIGAVISAGVEIRFNDKDKGIGFRLASHYRFLTGTVGGVLAGSDLSTVQISLGLVF